MLCPILLFHCAHHRRPLSTKFLERIKRSAHGVCRKAHFLSLGRCSLLHCNITVFAYTEEMFRSPWVFTGSLWLLQLCRPRLSSFEMGLLELRYGTGMNV